MKWGPLLRVFRRLHSGDTGEGLSDGELLERYLARRDEAAFATLLERHGPMVLGVCRRVLRNEADAEDAFQATFLVLVQKGVSVALRDKVGNWLYGVACRTAAHARASAAARRARERALARPEGPSEEGPGDLGAVLDQELSRLPERYRAPLVLCDLEGRTRREAARTLGWPEGTVAGRLARARALLAGRLARRGLAVTPAALAALLPQQAVAVGPSLAIGTQRAAAALGGAIPGREAIAASVLALAEATLRSLLVNRIRLVAVCSLLVLLAGSAVALVLLWPGPPAPTPPAPPGPVAPGANPAPAEARRQDLQKLEGAWAAAEVETDGRKAPPDFVRRILWRFERGFLMIRGSLGDHREIPCTFEIDPGQTPRALSYTGLGTRQKVLGIYEVDGDRLRVCIIHRDRPRPTAFATEPGSGLTRILFERKK